MKKKLFLLSSVLIIAFLLSDFIVYKQTKKNLLDFFFPKTQNKKEIGENLLVKENQKIIIDDYTITLEEALCEKTTQLGYLVFSVQKDGEKVEADITKNGLLRDFGKNQRFAFDYEATGSFIQKAQWIDDVLYIYVSFEANEKTFEKPNFSDCIKIIDNKAQGNNAEKQYTFDFKYKNYCKKFKSDYGTLYISPLGCKLISTKELKNFNIKIKKEDGEMKLKRSDFSAAGEKENNKTKVWYTCRFDELLDISKVEEAVIGY